MDDSDTIPFHGLFIGVDTFRSSGIRPLKCAAKDAIALHALFTDHFGESARIVLDSAVTKAQLMSDLRHLVDMSTDDALVVISYSGHGSPTQELATFDTDPDNPAATALPLDEFMKLVAQIPARQLLVVLDCCFAGGADAKVLYSPGASRAGLPRSLDSVLSEVTGKGRVVLAASAADQEAKEDWRLGHGVFTYYLLKALQGAEEVVDNGQVPLYKMLAYLTRNVTARRSAFDQNRQDPGMAGKVDGDMRLPILKPGKLTRELGGMDLPPLATPVLESLLPLGIKEPILAAWARAGIKQLNTLQLKAINEAGLLAGNNVLVSAPTSAGKTLIGELAALHGALHGERAVFLLPARALVNEQYERFTKWYGQIIRTIRVTGELTDQVADLMQGRFGIAVLTYEKFTGLVFKSPDLLAQIDVLVVDEIQTLGSRDRGWTLELLLMMAKFRRLDGHVCQIVGLSAVLGDLGGLDSWLAADKVVTTERPVPLVEGVLDAASGRCQFRTENGEERTEQLLPAADDQTAVPLMTQLVSAGQRVIMFHGTRGLARSSADELARSLGLAPADGTLSQLPQGDPGYVTDHLRRCLSGESRSTSRI